MTPSTPYRDNRPQHTAGDPARSGAIALITEGTYPCHQGGVSVWCDQLIRGLPEHSFDLYAITGTGLERSVWERPGNLVNTVMMPIWGPVRGRSRQRKEPAEFTETHRRFVSALLDDDVDLFIDALRGLRRFAQYGDLTAGLTSDASLRHLHKAWINAPHSSRESAGAYAPSVADAIHATASLEHLMRPLATPVARADIYHASSNGLASLIAMVGKWTHGTRFILTEHGIYLRERYMALAYRDATYPVRMLVLRFVRLVTAAAYREADLITPGSHFNRRWQERNGADPEKVRPVHNGVDHHAFPEVGPEPDVRTLVWVGRVDPLKDLETLIQAAALVRAQVPEFRLRMFGSVPAGNETYAERCRALIGQLNLTEHAFFEGRIPEIRDAYEAASVVVLSSTSEGFPYTVIEAMMSGRATVSTDVGGVAEAVGDAGLVVAPRDPAALADACLALLLDRRRREQFGKAARARALEFFTLDRFLDVYRGIYTELGAVPAPIAVAHTRPEPVSEPAAIWQFESVQPT